MTCPSIRGPLCQTDGVNGMTWVVHCGGSHTTGDLSPGWGGSHKDLSPYQRRHVSLISQRLGASAGQSNGFLGCWG